MEEIPKKSIFADRSFLLYALSALVSLIGDQLTLIALPWLMLTLTNDPVAVGIMFALLGVPRAVMILVGGALADRFHPASILMLTRLLSWLALSVLALMCWQNQVQPMHLYVFATLLGLTSAIAYPAGASLLPRLLHNDLLRPANGIMMGLTQLAALVGPVASGVIIHTYKDSGLENVGYAVVFGLDGLTFLAAAVLLKLIAFPAEQGLADGDRPGLRQSLAEGWTHIRSDAALSSFLLYIGLVSLFTTGPLLVGVPLLVRDELQGGVLQYSTFLVFMNIGALLSMFLVPTMAAIPKPRFIAVMLCLDMLIGLLMVVFVNIKVPGLPQAILLVVGMIAAYVQIALITRIQMRVDRRYLGRVMSYVMFAYAGLVPVSASLAGFAVKHFSAKQMFEAVGVIIALIALLFLFNRKMRSLAVDAPAEASQPTAGAVS